MEAKNHTDTSNENLRLIENLRKILSATSKKTNDNDAHLLYKNIKDTLEDTEDNLNKEYQFLNHLNEYLEEAISNNDFTRLSSEHIFSKVHELKRQVYGEPKPKAKDTKHQELYKIAIKYINQELESSKDQNKEELIAKDKRVSLHLANTLGNLFGKERGQIIGAFNTGMYGMTQEKVQELLKNMNISYKDNHFTNLMDEDLLRTRLAGLRLIQDNIDEIFYDLEINPNNLDSSTILNVEGASNLKAYSKIIGTAVKDLYYAETGLTPLEKLKNEKLQELEKNKNPR